MKNFLVVCTFLAFAACGKKGGDAGDKIIADYTAAKTKLCACADKDCATKAKAEADAVEERAGKEVPKPSKELETKFEAIEKEVNECARKYE